MWGVVAVAAVTAIAQAYQSEKARGANSSKLKEIEKAFSELVPPEYDLSPNDPPNYITQQLQAANFDFSSLTPEQFKVIGTYAPEAAEYVAETNPTLVQQTATGQEGRQAQINALREFQKIAQGENPELKAALEVAARDAQTQAQSRTESLLQDEARRGMLGSGKSFAAMLQGNSDAMLRGADQGRAAALEAYRSKLQAIQDSGTMGRQLASDELSQQQTNADIINQFNQRTSKAYQEYLNNRANLANSAQLTNLQNAQDIANKNVTQNNDFAVQNQRTKNDLLQQQYQNTRDERNYQNDLAKAQASWAAGEKERLNAYKNKTYQDQLAKTSGMAGVGYKQIDQNTQNAQDRNAMISGVGSSISGGLAQQQNENFLREQNAANQAAEDARQKKQQQFESAQWSKYYGLR